MRPSITLETKCWEADWRLLLTTDRLRTLAERNCFDFAERTLMINNVADQETVRGYAERGVASGLLTRYLVVGEHADEAMRFFQVTAETLTEGYKYSIAELVSVYLCRTDYLLHFAGDCLPLAAYDWIPRAIACMNANPLIKVANLTWDAKYAEAEAESAFQTDDFFVGFGFSDQCYLVRTADFRAPIYNDVNEASARYPGYGGELFEKRVDAWMRNHGFLRATFKHGTYLHEKHDPPAPSRFRLALGRVLSRVRRVLSFMVPSSRAGASGR